MNQNESYTLDDKYKASLRSVNSLKRKERISRKQSRNNVMSTTTKDFIQKICYRKTASIDMTQYGFINDSKLHPVNLLMKPLRAQLEKICGKPSMNGSVRKNSPARKKGKSSLQTMQETVPTPRRIQRHAGSPSLATPSTPVSASSSPGSHLPRSRVRKVRLYEPTTTKKKKVTLILPGAKDKKK